MSGLKFMGKDPAGNAKAISVNDDGVLLAVTQLMGSITAQGKSMLPVLNYKIKWETLLESCPEKMTLGEDGYIYTIRTGSIKKINPVNGEVVWEYLGLNGVNMRAIHADRNGNVYAGDNGTLCVLNKDGELVQEVSQGTSSISCIKVVGDFVYITPFRVELKKLPINDLGSPEWQFSNGKTLRNVRVFGGSVFFNDDSGYYYKVDDETGNLVWSHQESLVLPIHDLAFDRDGYLYSAGRYGNTLGNCLIKFDVSSDVAPQKIWQQDRDEAVMSGIAIAGDRVYTCNIDGELALRDLDGNLIWRKQVTGRRIDDLCHNPGGLYLTSRDNFIRSLDKELQIVGYREV